jgi:thiol:disulfide interchange protein DsbD
MASRVLAAAAGLLVAGAVTAQPVRTDHVEAELVSARTAIVPGEPTQVALRLAIAPGWHTYWRNPGDSGLPTTLEWKLPDGYKASEIDWPPPRPLPAGPLVNYGYEGEALHLVTLTAPASAKPGESVPLRAHAEWLVCKDTCIPESAELSLDLPVATRADVDPRFGAKIDAAAKSIPKPLTGWKVEATGQGQKIALRLTPPAGAPAAGTLRFFPFSDGRVEPSAPQPTTRDGDAYVVTLPVSSQLDKNAHRLDGVVSASRGLASGGATVGAATIDVALAGTIAPGPKPALDASSLSATSSANDLSLAAAAFFAFIGGILLNLMPCVFPVLSLKALSLAAPGHDDHRLLRAQGIAFAAGVIGTFLVLAGVLIALRAAGEQIGWGFQLQSPAVVSVLAVLFFVIAQNLSGVFEFGALVPGGAAGWSLRNPYADAILSGVLAVVIASPCTAPFMGAALGFALTGSTAATLAVFAALGVGMALPYALLAAFPEWRRVLPRPGAWMERLKQLLAFPLYATVAWLAWVLGAQVDNDAVVRLLVTLVIVAFALWSWRAYRGGGARAWSFVALAALIGAVFVAWPLLAGDRDPTTSAQAPRRVSDSRWQAWSTERVAELANEGRPVFVDFTAAWCVTCQVNKRLVLNDNEVGREFARKNVVLMRADWTRRDPEITRALGELGRNGVPVYVLFRPGKQPLLLPEVLQKSMVVDALATIDARS